MSNYTGLKKIIRKLIYFLFKRIVFIVESQNESLRLGRLIQMATIDSTAHMVQSFNIINLQNDKTKITIGKKSSLRGEIFLFQHGGNVTIGDYVLFGPYSRIWSSCKITIGNHVLISHNVNIHDNDSHPTDSVLRQKQSTLQLEPLAILNSEFNVSEKPIIIEDNVWICFNAVILKGVTIGKGAIVAASAVVTEDVPPFTVVAGNPARVIKHLKPIQE